MIQSLSIENFAIIDEIYLDFNQAMTVLSGETGAGKSIIIDALGILCGGRGSSEFIRRGQDRLIVEGLFTFQKYPQEIEIALRDFGLELDLAQDDLLIRREIQTSGKNLIRINGQLANVSLLKEIGSFLVDIHGQNEHQALLNKQQHLFLLDQFAGKDFDQLMKDYQLSYQNYQAARHKLDHLKAEDSYQEQRLNFLEFQIKEIEAVHLVEGEFEELSEISSKLQHQQQLQTNLHQINYLLSDFDQSILVQWQELVNLLEANAEFDSSYQELHKQAHSMQFDIEDISQQLSRLGVEDDSNQSLDDIESRLGQLSQLKRKYNMEISEIIAYYQEISEEVYQLTHKEKLIEESSRKVIETYQGALNLAKQLSVKRHEIAQTLEKAVEKELADLYMGDSRFQVKIEDSREHSYQLADEQVILKDLGPQGFDHIEFYVATNVGEDLKPLVQVASGGELSRFMLALKTVFSRKDSPKTMVFDEIDTGVSGRVAKAIAEKIKSISQVHQVLCITHLPQVAAIADEQIYIRKMVDEGRTYTQASILTLEKRVDQIAMMISGSEITKASLQIAEELINEYNR